MQKLIYILMSVLLLVGCNSNNSTTSDLKLNNGEKWEVNAEMKPHIEQENEILNNYLSENSNNYQELAEALKNQNNNLIKSCTMKGEGHDELHKWLLPHLELVENLSNANDVKEAKSVVFKIEASFKTYHAYFD